MAEALAEVMTEVLSLMGRLEGFLKTVRWPATETPCTRHPAEITETPSRGCSSSSRSGRRSCWASAGVGQRKSAQVPAQVRAQVGSFSNRGVQGFPETAMRPAPETPCTRSPAGITETPSRGCSSSSRSSGRSGGRSCWASAGAGRRESAQVPAQVGAQVRSFSNRGAQRFPEAATWAFGRRVVDGASLEAG